MEKTKKLEIKTVYDLHRLVDTYKSVLGILTNTNVKVNEYQEERFTRILTNIENFLVELEYKVENNSDGVWLTHGDDGTRVEREVGE